MPGTPSRMPAFVRTVALWLGGLILLWAGMMLVLNYLPLASHLYTVF